MKTLMDFYRRLLLKVQAVKILIDEGNLEAAKREIEMILEILGKQ